MGKDSHGGTTSPSWTALVNLAEAHHRIGEDERALDLLVEAAYIYGSLGSEYLIRLATVHDNMGRICRDLDRYDARAVSVLEIIPGAERAGRAGSRDKGA